MFLWTLPHFHVPDTLFYGLCFSVSFLKFLMCPSIEFMIYLSLSVFKCYYLRNASILLFKNLTVTFHVCFFSISCYSIFKLIRILLSVSHLVIELSLCSFLQTIKKKVRLRSYILWWVQYQALCHTYSNR